MEETKDPVRIEYIPPASHKVEAYGREVCTELGEEFTEPEVVEGFTKFIKVVVAFAERRLNSKGFDNDDG